MHLAHIQLTAAGILALAGTIYGFLQAAKKAGLDGYISGRLGVAFSVAFGFLATICVAGNLSANTLCAAVAVALAAAGIHANVKVAANGTLAAPSPTPGASTTGKLAVIALVGVLGLSASAFSCGQWDQSAYETLAVTKVVVDTAAADYATGAIAQSQAHYAAVTTAQAAQTAAVDALETYELAKAAASTSQTVLDADLNATEAAIGNLGPLVAAIEALDPKARAQDTRTAPLQ